MSRAGEVLRPRDWIGERPYCLGAIVRRDARRRTVPIVDGDRERRPVDLRVVRNHRRQSQLLEPLAHHRLADDAARVADEKADGLGRDRFARHDEVRFVLAILIVRDDDHAAAADIAQDLVGGIHGLNCASRSRYRAS